MVRTSFQRIVQRDRWRLCALIAIPSLLLALALDGPAYRLLSIKKERGQDAVRVVEREARGDVEPRELDANDDLTAEERTLRWRIEQSQFYQMLRLVGYVPAWLAVVIGADLHRRWRLRRRAGGWSVGGDDRGPLTPGMLVCLLVTGLVVVLLKALIGRERPGVHDGAVVFKPLLSGFWDGSNLSTPSSHAAIAFCGALVVSRLRPGTGLVAIPLAIGCAYTRVLMGAHFLSDIVLAAIVAWVVVELVLREPS